MAGGSAYLLLYGGCALAILALFAVGAALYLWGRGRAGKRPAGGAEQVRLDRPGPSG